MHLRVLQCSFLANLLQARCPGFSLRDLGESRKRRPLTLPWGYQRDCGQLKPTSGKGKDIFFSAESFIKLYDLKKSIHQVLRLSNKPKHYSSSQGCSQITWDHRCGRPSTEGSAAGFLPSFLRLFSNSFPFGLRTCPRPRPTLHQSHPPSALIKFISKLLSSSCSGTFLSPCLPDEVAVVPTDEGNYIHSTHLRQRSAWVATGRMQKKGRQPWGWRTSSLLRPWRLRLTSSGWRHEGLSVWQCRHVV